MGRNRIEKNPLSFKIGVCLYWQRVKNVQKHKSLKY